MVNVMGSLTLFEIIGIDAKEKKMVEPINRIFAIDGTIKPALHEAWLIRTK